MILTLPKIESRKIFLSLFSKFIKFTYLSLFLNTKLINPQNDKLYLSIDEPVYPLKGGDG